jgi:hypothetical protein
VQTTKGLLAELTNGTSAASWPGMYDVGLALQARWTHTEAPAVVRVQAARARRLAMSKKRPESVSIIFQEKEPKPTIPVSGAWGGPNFLGEVIAHVYVESLTIPSLMTTDIGPKGEVDFDKADTIKRGDVVREVQATLVMSPEIAHSFGTWLVEKAKQALMTRPKIDDKK